MRIALLVTDLTPPRIGGISKVATSLAEHFTKMGHEVEVFCLERNLVHHQQQKFKLQGVKPKWIFYRDYPVVAFSLQAFKDLLKRHKVKPFDISHAMNFNNIGMIPQYLNFKKARLVHVSTGFETTQMEIKAKWSEFLSKPNFHNLAQIAMESLLAPWQRAYIGWASAITTEDSETERQFIKMGLDSQKIHRIPSGVDYAALSTYKTPPGFHLPMSPTAKMILCPGRVDPRKGCQYLLRAFARVADSLVGTELVFAGGGRGSYLEDMQKMAVSLGLSGRVHFTGKVDDLRPFYACAHAVVLPSLSEGIPITLQEALVFKKPVLCSKLEGTYAWAKDLKSIVWAPPADIVALSKGLQTVMLEPAFDDLNASAQWMKNFDWAEVAKAYLAVYEWALQQQKTA